MPYSDYRPELMGSATLEPGGAFEAGSLQSFTLVYTAGKFGLDDTGSIKIGFRFATDLGPLQFDDPKGQGYTTAEASNGATLELKWEFKRNIRPWSRSLYVGVAKHFLKPGDTITIRFGDRRQGAPGVRLQTYAESRFEFHVLVDAIATYDYVALPESPRIAIVPGPGIAWRAVLPTMVRAGEPFRLGIKCEDKWGNPSNLMEHALALESSRPVEALPRQLRMERGSFAAVVDALVVREAGDLTISVRGEDGAELARTNPLRVVPQARLQHDVPQARLQHDVPQARLQHDVPQARLQHDVPQARLQHDVPQARLQHDVPQARLQHDPQARLQHDPSEAPLVHFWGDTHGQSDETLGTGSAREYFLFGRDRAFLDVMGHQGNDFQITGAFWRDLNQLTKELDQPGHFVAIPGYEWSANTAVGGDRNVHFRHEGETIHRSSHAQIADAGDMVDEHTDAHTARDLFVKLAGRDCVVAAHVGGRYADIKLAHDGILETAVEVHSAWGTFEWLVADAFEKGYRVGICANSDGHKGRPGACYPGASFFGAMGGLTCFLSPSLDRDAIFEAMRRRHHYATTGNRLLLSVEVEAPVDAERFVADPALVPGAASQRTRRLIMGDIARVAADAVDLHVEVVGSAPIERVEVWDATDLLETIRPYTEADLGPRLRLLYQGAEYRGRARTTVWDGGLEVEGNAILGARMLNNWNLDRGIQRATRGGVTWKAVTTGNFGAIDVALERPREGRIAFETKHAKGIMQIGAIGLEDRVFQGGGLGRAVKLYRLPERLSERRVAFHRRIELREKGDTRLFVRVTQEDGHRAWSSPIYLFK